MSPQHAKMKAKVEAFAMDNGYDAREYKGYSGRGMFGKTSTLAYVFEFHPDTEDGNTVTNMGFHSDSLGKQYIYYTKD